jgi:hypothetical protein
VKYKLDIVLLYVSLEKLADRYAWEDASASALFTTEVAD